ncbi:hypothetical protein Pint_26899 [Pistacia integerrima]|uniref:Uncharacterized protein n=1 Tax=Pistacia integerrima TaxID=434235 RepID=A0ACC0YQY4_9ROSI|nr:hypothetical protein Pint_26899 [Pistacia integerrima]
MPWTASRPLSLTAFPLSPVMHLVRELSNNNITGEIPVALGNLTNLVSLDLYLNSFSGPIPDSFGKLTKLRFLYNLFP